MEAQQESLSTSSWGVLRVGLSPIPGQYAVSLIYKRWLIYLIPKPAVEKLFFQHVVVVVVAMGETGRQCLLEVKHPTVTVTAIHCLHSQGHGSLDSSARSELASTASQHQLGMAPAPTAAPQQDTVRRSPRTCQGPVQHSTLRQAQRPRCVAMPRPQMGRFLSTKRQLDFCRVLVLQLLVSFESLAWSVLVAHKCHSSCGSRMQDTGGRWSTGGRTRYAYNKKKGKEKERRSATLRAQESRPALGERAGQPGDAIGEISVMKGNCLMANQQSRMGGCPSGKGKKRSRILP